MESQRRLHRDKNSIVTRKECEIRLGEKIYIPSKQLKKNRVAFKKWNELVLLYSGAAIDFVSSSDHEVIERYCFTHAEYLQLKRIDEKIDGETEDELMNVSKKMLLGLYEKINKKLEILNQLEDLLFLNPVSKIKNIHKVAPQKEETPEEKAGFGYV